VVRRGFVSGRCGYWSKLDRHGTDRCWRGRFGPLFGMSCARARDGVARRDASLGPGPGPWISGEPRVGIFVYGSRTVNARIDAHVHVILVCFLRRGTGLGRRILRLHYGKTGIVHAGMITRVLDEIGVVAAQLVHRARDHRRIHLPLFALYRGPLRPCALAPGPEFKLTRLHAFSRVLVYACRCATEHVKKLGCIRRRNRNDVVLGVALDASESARSNGPCARS
jgi:hypothetical protein